ncbi:MAG: PilZ domain-containing protein [Pseudodesulfovibrio sp.]|uniref:PilZ domain-containing protein n=1 Tax=Pseudodesulfovibrio sp. TaxID=2035812 RepID=UPI003D0C3904
MGILDSLGKIFSKSGKDGSPAAGKKAGPAARPGKDDAAPTPKPSSAQDRDEAFHAGPVDEGALGFSITIKDGKITKRKAFRITVDGLAVFIPRLGKTFPVSDISASGLGFRFLKPRIKCGVKIRMDLLINGGREVEGVLCKVMRHEQGVVGCAFTELDRKQEDAVSRIVLEGEKQLAARRNASRKGKPRS